MSKYRVVGDTVTYGGPKNFSVDNWHLSGATLLDCIDFVKSRVLEDSCIDIDTILSTREDSMGTYTRYIIQRDNSIETIWIYLSQGERVELFQSAIAHLSSCKKDSLLLGKIKQVEL
jgi:hypothetical protein